MYSVENPDDDDNGGHYKSRERKRQASKSPFQQYEAAISGSLGRDSGYSNRGVPELEGRSSPRSRSRSKSSLLSSHGPIERGELGNMVAQMPHRSPNPNITRSLSKPSSPAHMYKEQPYGSMSAAYSKSNYTHSNASPPQFKPNILQRVETEKLHARIQDGALKFQEVVIKGNKGYSPKTSKKASPNFPVSLQSTISLKSKSGNKKSQKRETAQDKQGRRGLDKTSNRAKSEPRKVQNISPEISWSEQYEKGFGSPSIKVFNSLATPQMPSMNTSPKNSRAEKFPNQSFYQKRKSPSPSEKKNRRSESLVEFNKTNNKERRGRMHDYEDFSLKKKLRAYKKTNDKSHISRTGDENISPKIWRSSLNGPIQDNQSIKVDESRSQEKMRPNNLRKALPPTHPAHLDPSHILYKSSSPSVTETPRQQICSSPSTANEAQHLHEGVKIRVDGKPTSSRSPLIDPTHISKSPPRAEKGSVSDATHVPAKQTEKLYTEVWSTDYEEKYPNPITSVDNSRVASKCPPQPTDQTCEGGYSVSKKYERETPLSHDLDFRQVDASVTQSAIRELGKGFQTHPSHKTDISVLPNGQDQGDEKSRIEGHTNPANKEATGVLAQKRAASDSNPGAPASFSSRTKVAPSSPNIEHRKGMDDTNMRQALETIQSSMPTSIKVTKSPSSQTANESCKQASIAPTQLDDSSGNLALQPSLVALKETKVSIPPIMNHNETVKRLSQMAMPSWHVEVKSVSPKRIENQEMFTKTSDSQTSSPAKKYETEFSKGINDIRKRQETDSKFANETSRLPVPTSIKVTKSPPSQTANESCKQARTAPTQLDDSSGNLAPQPSLVALKETKVSTPPIMNHNETVKRLSQMAMPSWHVEVKSVSPKRIENQEMFTKTSDSQTSSPAKKYETEFSKGINDIRKRQETDSKFAKETSRLPVPASCPPSTKSHNLHSDKQGKTLRKSQRLSNAVSQENKGKTAAGQGNVEHNVKEQLCSEGVAGSGLNTNRFLHAKMENSAKPKPSETTTSTDPSSEVNETLAARIKFQTPMANLVRKRLQSEESSPAKMDGKPTTICAPRRSSSAGSPEKNSLLSPPPLSIRVVGSESREKCDKPPEDKKGIEASKSSEDVCGKCVPLRPPSCQFRKSKSSSSLPEANKKCRTKGKKKGRQPKSKKGRPGDDGYQDHCSVFKRQRSYDSRTGIFGVLSRAISDQLQSLAVSTCRFQYPSRTGFYRLDNSIISWVGGALLHGGESASTLSSRASDDDRQKSRDTAQPPYRNDSDDTSRDHTASLLSNDDITTNVQTARDYVSTSGKDSRGSKMGSNGWSGKSSRGPRDGSKSSHGGKRSQSSGDESKGYVTTTVCSDDEQSPTIEEATQTSSVHLPFASDNPLPKEMSRSTVPVTDHDSKPSAVSMKSSDHKPISSVTSKLTTASSDQKSASSFFSKVTTALSRYSSKESSSTPRSSSTVPSQNSPSTVAGETQETPRQSQEESLKGSEPFSRKGSSNKSLKSSAGSELKGSEPFSRKSSGNKSLKSSAGSELKGSEPFSRDGSGNESLKSSTGSEVKGSEPFSRKGSSNKSLKSSAGSELKGSEPFSRKSSGNKSLKSSAGSELKGSEPFSRDGSGNESLKSSTGSEVKGSEPFSRKSSSNKSLKSSAGSELKGSEPFSRDGSGNDSLKSSTGSEVKGSEPFSREGSGNESLKSSTGSEAKVAPTSKSREPSDAVICSETEKADVVGTSDQESIPESTKCPEKPDKASLTIRISSPKTKRGLDTMLVINPCEGQRKMSSRTGHVSFDEQKAIDDCSPQRCLEYHSRRATEYPRRGSLKTTRCYNKPISSSEFTCSSQLSACMSSSPRMSCRGAARGDRYADCFCYGPGRSRDPCSERHYYEAKCRSPREKYESTMSYGYRLRKDQSSRADEFRRISSSKADRSHLHSDEISRFRSSGASKEKYISSSCEDLSMPQGFSKGRTHSYQHRGVESCSSSDATVVDNRLLSKRAVERDARSFSPSNSVRLASADHGMCTSGRTKVRIHLHSPCLKFSDGKQRDSHELSPSDPSSWKRKSSRYSKEEARRQSSRKLLSTSPVSPSISSRTDDGSSNSKQTIGSHVSGSSTGSVKHGLESSRLHKRSTIESESQELRHDKTGVLDDIKSIQEMNAGNQEEYVSDSLKIPYELLQSDYDPFEMPPHSLPRKITSQEKASDEQPTNVKKSEDRQETANDQEDHDTLSSLSETNAAKHDERKSPTLLRFSESDCSMYKDESYGSNQDRRRSLKGRIVISRYKSSDNARRSGCHITARKNVNVRMLIAKDGKKQCVIDEMDYPEAGRESARHYDDVSCHRRSCNSPQRRKTPSEIYTNCPNLKKASFDSRQACSDSHWRTASRKLHETSISPEKRSMHRRSTSSKPIFFNPARHGTLLHPKSYLRSRSNSAKRNVPLFTNNESIDIFNKIITPEQPMPVSRDTENCSPVTGYLDNVEYPVFNDASNSESFVGERRSISTSSNPSTNEMFLINPSPLDFSLPFNNDTRSLRRTTVRRRPYNTDSALGFGSQDDSSDFSMVSTGSMQIWSGNKNTSSSNGIFLSPLLDGNDTIPETSHKMGIRNAFDFVKKVTAKTSLHNISSPESSVVQMVSGHPSRYFRNRAVNKAKSLSSLSQSVEAVESLRDAQSNVYESMNTLNLKEWTFLQMPLHDEKAEKNTCMHSVVTLETLRQATDENGYVGHRDAKHALICEMDETLSRGSGDCQHANCDSPNDKKRNYNSLPVGRSESQQKQNTPREHKDSVPSPLQNIQDKRCLSAADATEELSSSQYQEENKIPSDKFPNSILGIYETDSGDKEDTELLKCAFPLRHSSEEVGVQVNVKRMDLKLQSEMCVQICYPDQSDYSNEDLQPILNNTDSSEENIRLCEDENSYSMSERERSINEEKKGIDIKGTDLKPVEIVQSLRQENNNKNIQNDSGNEQTNISHLQMCNVKNKSCTDLTIREQISHQLSFFDSLSSGPSSTTSQSTESSIHINGCTVKATVPDMIDNKSKVSDRHVEDNKCGLLPIEIEDFQKNQYTSNDNVKTVPKHEPVLTARHETDGAMRNMTVLEETSDHSQSESVSRQSASDSGQGSERKHWYIKYNPASISIYDDDTRNNSPSCHHPSCKRTEACEGASLETNSTLPKQFSTRCSRPTKQFTASATTGKPCQNNRSVERENNFTGKSLVNQDTTLLQWMTGTLTAEMKMLGSRLCSPFSRSPTPSMMKSVFSGSSVDFSKILSRESTGSPRRPTVHFTRNETQTINYEKFPAEHTDGEEKAKVKRKRHRRRKCKLSLQKSSTLSHLRVSSEGFNRSFYGHLLRHNSLSSFRPNTIGGRVCRKCKYLTRSQRAKQHKIRRCNKRKKTQGQPDSTELEKADHYLYHVLADDFRSCGLSRLSRRLNSIPLSVESESLISLTEEFQDTSSSESSDVSEELNHDHAESETCGAIETDKSEETYQEEAEVGLYQLSPITEESSVGDTESDVVSPEAAARKQLRESSKHQMKSQCQDESKTENSAWLEGTEPQMASSHSDNDNIVTEEGHLGGRYFGDLHRIEISTIDKDNSCDSGEGDWSMHRHYRKESNMEQQKMVLELVGSKHSGTKHLSTVYNSLPINKTAPNKRESVFKRLPDDYNSYLESKTYSQRRSRKWMMQERFQPHLDCPSLRSTRIGDFDSRLRGISRNNSSCSFNSARPFSADADLHLSKSLRSRSASVVSADNYVVYRSHYMRGLSPLPSFTRPRKLDSDWFRHSTSRSHRDVKYHSPVQLKKWDLSLRKSWSTGGNWNMNANSNNSPEDDGLSENCMPCAEFSPLDAAMGEIEPEILRSQMHPSDGELDLTDMGYCHIPCCNSYFHELSFPLADTFTFHTYGPDPSRLIADFAHQNLNSSGNIFDRPSTSETDNYTKAVQTQPQREVCPRGRDSGDENEQTPYVQHLSFVNGLEACEIGSWVEDLCNHRLHSHAGDSFVEPDHGVTDFSHVSNNYPWHAVDKGCHCPRAQQGYLSIGLNHHSEVGTCSSNNRCDHDEKKRGKRPLLVPLVRNSGHKHNHGNLHQHQRQKAQQMYKCYAADKTHLQGGRCPMSKAMATKWYVEDELTEVEAGPSLLKKKDPSKAITAAICAWSGGECTCESNKLQGGSEGLGSDYGSEEESEGTSWEDEYDSNAELGTDDEQYSDYDDGDDDKDNEVCTRKSRTFYTKGMGVGHSSKALPRGGVPQKLQPTSNHECTKLNTTQNKNTLRKQGKENIKRIFSRPHRKDAVRQPSHDTGKTHGVRGKKDLHLEQPCKVPAHQPVSIEGVRVQSVAKERVRFACDENGDWAEIGRGSYGCVYLGLLDGVIEVAIKDFYESNSYDQVIHEARMLAFLQDTGITPKFYGLRRRFDVTKQPGEFCIIMEYFGEGKTLFNVLSEKIELAFDEWLDVLGQLVAGLKLIHRRNVLLNDLKADNILIDLCGGRKSIRYIDVGMATYKHGLTFQLPQDQMGKYNFLAPEVRDGAHTSRKSDIYSLGYMLEQMTKPAGAAFNGLMDVVQSCLYVSPKQRPSVDQIMTNVHKFIVTKTRSRAVIARPKVALSSSV